TLDQIKCSLPPSVFIHRPMVSLIVLGRNIIMAATLLFCMTALRTALENNALIVIIWLLYWWFQGLVFTGLWVIGHECAHESFLPSKFGCIIIGLTCHTLLFTPHLSWKATHRIHHHYHGHMVHDQHWIPPLKSEALYRKKNSWFQYVEDTPLVVFAKLVLQQLVGFQSYLLFNISGPQHYPLSTSHFNPFSIMFKAQDRLAVIISDISIIVMGYIIFQVASKWGVQNTLLLYGIPYLIVSHWVTMIVYLHHTDPIVPHYRDRSWNYTRGALATVDRDFLGWQGRFFLHNIAHFHIVHHLFPRIPFYNMDLATQHVKALIGKDYHATNKPVFQSLWQNYQSCQFVEDQGQFHFFYFTKL
ncbi:fatty acid desaturase-domain-containing protein, partial [Lentinula raphanica]